MRLFFEDPDGERLALDTNAGEWAATYEPDGAEISDEHFIINVEAPEVLRRIEREADFCGFGYNKDIEDERRHPQPQTSVYAEYLQELAAFNIRAEACGNYENGASAEDLTDELDRIKGRLEGAKNIGYFSAKQYAALLLIVDDIQEDIDLYNRCEKVYNEAAAEPF